MSAWHREVVGSPIVFFEDPENGRAQRGAQRGPAIRGDEDQWL